MNSRLFLHARPAVSKVNTVTELGLQTRLLQALRKPKMDDTRPDVLIGVDGGSTKTQCVVLSCSSLTSIAMVKGGGCNGNSEGRQEADQVLAQCIEAAVRKAGLRPEQVKGVACGLSGLDTVYDARGKRILLRNVLQQLQVPDYVPCWVFNDAIAALASATRGPPHGICTVAGTGSICIGIAGKSFHRASGWGGTIGDGGGGFDIGRKALAAVAASVDERQPPTALSSALAQACQVTSMSELLRWVYRDTSWAGVASLAPSVLACAAAGDAAAVAILEQAGSELVESVAAVAARLQADSNDGPIPVILSGRLLGQQESSMYSNIVEQLLHDCLPEHRILRPIVDSATGSALLGAHYLRSGTPDTEGAYCQGIIDELPRSGLVEPALHFANELAVARKPH